MLRHKVKCLPSLYPVSEVTRAFERTRLMSWRDVFYVTDDKELRAELEWGLMRKLERERPWKLTDAESANMSAAEIKKAVGSRRERMIAEAFHDFDFYQPDAFERTLSDCEFRFLSGYRARYPGKAWSLNQNPESFAPSVQVPI